MKNILFLLPIVLLFSCENNKPKTETTTTKDSVTTTIDKKENNKDHQETKEQNQINRRCIDVHQF